METVIHIYFLFLDSLKKHYKYDIINTFNVALDVFDTVAVQKCVLVE